MSSPDSSPGDIHSGKSLIRGAIWSGAGQILPLIVTLVTIPQLLSRLGDARFGLLTLFWLLVGYFSIFDLGLGRSLILAFSRTRLGIDREKISLVFWTGSSLLFVLGCAIGFAVHAGAELISATLGVSPGMAEEATGAIRVVGWTMAPMLLMHVVQGMPTAFQKQKELNLLRIPAGMLSHLIPFAMSIWTTDLRDLMWANLGLRLLLLAASTWLAFTVQPIDLAPRATRSMARELLGTGAWMMVSNLMAALLMNLDRLAISHRMGPGALASYAPAMDVANKTMLLPGVALALLFPALGHHLRHSPEKAAKLFDSSMRTLVWWAPPFLLAGIALASPTMRLWLGPSHGEAAGQFLSIFLFGVSCGLPGWIIISLIQASDRSRTASMIHMIQVPILAGGLYLALEAQSIQIVAWIWAGRHLLDTTAMYLVSRRIRSTVKDRGILVPFAAGFLLLSTSAALVSNTSSGEWTVGSIALLWVAIALFLPAGRASIPYSLARFLPSGSQR